MATKMKGLLKGLRYISQIFEEEKEQEIEIGFPTDVKHVAHIGWDGAAVESPSWMKDFKPQEGFHTAPLGPPAGDPPRQDRDQVHLVSEDSKRSQETSNPPAPDLPEVPRSSRRHQTVENNTNSDSPRKKDPTKQRHSRKNQSKDPSVSNLKSNQEPGATSSTARTLPDVPKKTRRKKSKESNNGAGSAKSRSKEADGEGGSTPTRSRGAKKGDNASTSDTRPNNGSVLRTSNSHQGTTRPSVHDEEEESIVYL